MNHRTRSRARHANDLPADRNCPMIPATPATPTIPETSMIDKLAPQLAGGTVFVYGSLLRGLQNHRVIESGTFLGTAMTVDADFTMRDYGAYPAVYLGDTPKGHVVGEVYQVDGTTMQALDRLEGFPHFYDRQQVEVRLTSTVNLSAPTSLMAWIYVMTPTRTPNRRQAVVPDNDWRAWYATKHGGSR